MGIDHVTGDVVWTPRDTDAGPQLVVLRVTDGRGGLDLQGIPLDVTSLNEPPSFTSIPYGPASKDREWTYELTADDPNGDVLAYQLLVNPAGMTIVTNGGKSVVHWTPSATGEFRVRLAVDDGRGGHDYQEFDLPVTNNGPPRITSVPAPAVELGDQYEYPITTSDPDNDTVSLYLDEASSNRGMYIAYVGDDAFLRWTPNIVGDYEVSLTADDLHGGLYTQKFSVRVLDPIVPNGPPEFKSIPLGPAAADRPYQYQARAEDPERETLVYSLDAASLARGINIDSGSGLLTWLPAVGGTFHIEVTATDPHLNSATQKFELTVIDNSPPHFTSVPVQTHGIGSGAYTYQLTATDPNIEDLDDLHFFLDDGPTGMTLDAANVVRWASPIAGVFSVSVRVVDDQGAYETQSFDLQVVPVQNNPPVISQFSRTTIQGGMEYQQQIQASDPDGDALTYSLINVPGSTPAGLTMDDRGRVTWATTSADVRTEPYTYSVKVTDSHNLDSNTVTFTINVIAAPAPNSPPVFTSNPIEGAVVGRLYDYLATASDPDNDTITWSLDSGPEGMSIDSRTGRVTWVPLAAQLGDKPIIITATDALGAGVQQIYTVTTRSLNLAPQFDSTPENRVAVDSPYSYTIRASDPDDNADDLVFTLETPLSQASLVKTGPGTAVFTWDTPSTPISQSVHLRVTDPHNASADYTFVLDVTNSTSSNHAPTITWTPVQRAPEGVLYQHTVTATDIDPGDQAGLRYSLGSANNAPVSIDDTSGVLTWTSPAAGSYVVSVIVRDKLGTGLGSQLTYPLVIASDAAPSITSSPSTSVVAGAVQV